MATTDKINVVNVSPRRTGNPLKLIARNNRKAITNGPASAILPLKAMKRAIKRHNSEIPTRIFEKPVLFIEQDQMLTDMII